MGWEGAFWKPFGVAGMCVRGRGSGTGGREGPAALTRCHCPSLLTFLSQCGQPCSSPSLGSLRIQHLMSWAVEALAF